MASAFLADPGNSNIFGRFSPLLLSANNGNNAIRTQPKHHRLTVAIPRPSATQPPPKGAQRIALMDKLTLFAQLDATGVGQLVQMGVRKGRETRPNLKCGICGEHGGDPASIKFCAKAGLDYVSCSPYRVPIARLAAAQAAISVK